MIGLSEDAAGGGGARTIAHASVETIPEDSYTKKAINFLRRQHGGICPVEGHLDLDEEEDRLVDVMPFYTEDWGLPSLGTRWCQVLTVPRDNLKSSVDRAQITSLVVGFVAGGGFAVALCLLSLSVWRVFQTHRQWGRQKNAADYAEVLRAVEEVGSLGCPMVLIGARDFLELEKLVCYEDLRDAGKLVVLDSLEQVHDFRESNRIVFYSHQWPGWSEPDDERRSQLRAMQGAARSMLKMKGEKTLFVWVDYICVSQRHTKAQWMAVSSLPVYVLMVDTFIIIAPDATHRDTKDVCGLSTYTRRGWCRLEMLAKACGSGFQNMYSVEGTGTSLRRLSQEDFEHLSMNVFDGDFTVRSDMGKLVLPILGLYSLILRQSSEAKIEGIFNHKQKNKDRFFPQSYMAQDEHTEQPVKRRLFWDLVALMEEHVSEIERPKPHQRTEENHAEITWYL